MAETFTNELEKFFDNNTPGGYITTSVSISDNDLDQRINTAVNTTVSGQGFAKASELSSYAKITSLASVATSGSYNDLKDKPTIPAATSVSINRNIIEGTKIATITVNGTGTDLYAPAQDSSGGIITETDPIFSASPAANISADDIRQWNSSNDYDQLRNKPELANVAFSGSYNDLINLPTIHDHISIMYFNILEDFSYEYFINNFGQHNFYITESNTTNLDSSGEDDADIETYFNDIYDLLAEIGVYVILQDATNSYLPINFGKIGENIIQIDFGTVSTTNYTYNNNLETCLNNMNISYKIIQVVIDQEHHVLLSKIKEV